MMPEIANTCTCCRPWSKPPPASVELADSFNLQVDCKLLFVYRYIIFHLIDRCAQWHAACLVQSKGSPEMAWPAFGVAKQYYDRQVSKSCQGPASSILPILTAAEHCCETQATE